MNKSEPPLRPTVDAQADETEPAEPAAHAPPPLAGTMETAATPGPEQADAQQEAAPAPHAPTSKRAGLLSFIQDHPLPLVERLDRAQVKDYAVRAGKVAAIVFCAWFTVVVFLIAVYRFVNPPFSSLMVLQWLGGTSIEREWVPLDRISPNLMRAVITSEDFRFCRHWGIDFGEVLAALKRARNGTPRGASTITMQVAKNLFLWPSKSYVRKLVEVPLTYAIELMWPKRRILEVYLNIAEWGPGVFGAEAAAREHFGRSARRLTSRQAAQLAVALPNPVLRDAGDPGPWASRRASVIQRRAAGSPEAARCVLGKN